MTERRLIQTLAARSHMLWMALMWADEHAAEPLRSELLSCAAPLNEPLPISKERAQEILEEAKNLTPGHNGHKELDTGEYLRIETISWEERNAMRERFKSETVNA